MQWSDSFPPTPCTASQQIDGPIVARSNVKRCASSALPEAARSDPSAPEKRSWKSCRGRCSRASAVNRAASPRDAAQCRTMARTIDVYTVSRPQTQYMPLRVIDKSTYTTSTTSTTSRKSGTKASCKDGAETRCNYLPPAPWSSACRLLNVIHPGLRDAIHSFLSASLVLFDPVSGIGCRLTNSTAPSKGGHAKVPIPGLRSGIAGPRPETDRLQSRKFRCRLNVYSLRT